MNKVHIVKKGDTLWKISRYYNIDIHKLVKWNKLYGRKKHIIFPEQKIYLSAQKDEETPETYLTIQILDLGFHPIKKAKLILEFDGKKQNVTCDENGKITDIEIMHHEQGLKVHFQKYDKSYDLIASHKRLPIGKKKLTITSRTLKIDGKTLSKKGTQHDTVQSIKQDVKNKNVDTILKPSASNTKPDTPNNVVVHDTNDTHVQNVPHTQNTVHQSSDKPVGQQPKPAQPSQPHLSESKPDKVPNSAQHTSPTAPIIPIKKPEKVADVVRTEDGKPTYNIAQIFSEKNLLLHPDNDKYRKFIITAANKYGFTPQALAALINAEAALVKGTKEWNAKSYNNMKAGGLTQALEGTWLDACKGLGELKRTLVYERVQNQNIQSRTEKLNLRFDPELSIDFAPAYAIYNLNIFKKKFNLNKIDQLSPEDKAKFAYLAHHEGAYKLIMSSKNYTWENLQHQAGESAIPKYQKLFPNDPTNAYRYWMAQYIDSKIVVTNFMVNKNGIKVKSLEEIIVYLGGKTLVYPKSVSRNQQLSAPTNNNSAPTTPVENEVKFDVIFQDKTTKKPVANLQYNLVSPYGNKPHTTDSQGRDSGLGAKVGDKIEFVVNKQTVGTAKIVKNQLPILVTVDATNHQQQKQSVQQPTQQPLPSGLSRWHDPLDRCVIRTARLRSAKAATFGPVRIDRKTGRPRNHGGVDFEAAPGTPIKAVADGRVIHISEAYHDFGDASFGAFVILQCQLDDLPEPQKTVARKSAKGEFVWFFYAHLSEIDPKLKQFPDVSCGQVLGKTGFSGNAGGTKPPMNTIKNGAHLHFEARTIGEKKIAKGLENRFDPLPFFPYIKQP